MPRKTPKGPAGLITKTIRLASFANMYVSESGLVHLVLDTQRGRRVAVMTFDSKASKKIREHASASPLTVDGSVYVTFGHGIPRAKAVQP